ncbi:MAG: hypothetical protein COW42_15725, partial [Deltaproteobacteria bacterium CG17_big_fil_post_rev_8_21_14_2_50_63_7]
MEPRLACRPSVEHEPGRQRLALEPRLGRAHRPRRADGDVEVAVLAGRRATMNERLDQELRARVGQILAEKYRLVQLIGIGGMGAVYSAVNEWTHRPVAIKLLHTSRSAKHLLRFFREAQVTSKLDHPSIVKVFDLGKAGDGSYFLVQELLNGESMHELLARGALGLQQTMELTFPIMGALAAAHGAGVIHRDLKPA